MKSLHFLLRIGLSLSIAFAASFSSAVIFFDYSGYKEISDRVFLVIVPTLAIAFLLFEVFPKFWGWLAQRQTDILIVLGGFAILAALVVILPVAISRVYYLGMFTVALILFTVMLPAAPAMERIRSTHSLWHYFFGFLLGMLFIYAAIGFLSGVFKDRFQVVIFSIIFTMLFNVTGYYLVRRAVHSFRDGFPGNLLNIVLVVTLPLFLVAIIYISLQFPSMFIIGYIQMPVTWFGIFLFSAVVAGAWGIPLMEQFEARGFYHSFKQTRFFVFIKENLPGIYAGVLFFMINLVLARAFNHPTFSLNSLFFRADSGLWMSILGYPEGRDVNRSVHPLVLFTLRPLVQFVGLFTADKWFIAPMIVVAAMSGLCVLMAWLFVKRATQKDTYAFLFAIMLGTTSAHLIFGSLIETYIFGVTSLVFFILLVQADEKRFSVLMPAGLLVFGVTITNIAQSIIALFFKKFGFRRLIYFGVTLLAAGITLTAFISVLYPGNQSFFFVPTDISYESRYSQPVYESSMERIVEKTAALGRSIFLYGVVAPKPIEDITNKDTNPMIDFKTYDSKEQVYSWYSGLAVAPLVTWLSLLIGAFFFFFKDLRSSGHTPLMLGLLGCIAFNYILHMNYGTEFFLYSTYWTYLLIFFLALAFASLAGRPWFESLLTIFVWMLMINNAWFLVIIMRGLAPYFTSS